jgi:adenylate cyclase class IV
MVPLLVRPRPKKAACNRVVDHSRLEREVKLSVPHLDRVEARLQALTGAAASFFGCVCEQNYVLDTVDNALKARDERLRIREIAGRPGGQVTWKGPASVRGGVRRREEREFHADDRDARVALLSNLGLHPVCRYEKVRASWPLDDVLVCLGCRSGGYYSVMPPSTTMVWPVM